MKMKNYFNLQMKRTFKLYPAVLIITVITVCAILAAGLSFVKLNRESEKNTLLTVGIVGDIDGSYVKAGIEFLKSSDSSRFFANFIEFDSEEEALRLTKERKIHGYLKIPEGFFSDIYHGDNTPATYVTLGNANGMSSALMAEVTQTISSFVTETQNGIYCMQDIVHEYELDESTKPYTTKLNIRYVTEVLGRYFSFEAETLGLPDSVSTGAYYVCAVIIVLMLLWGISCHRILDSKNIPLAKLLNSTGFSPCRQVLSEYGAFLSVTLATALIFAAVFGIVCSITDIAIPEFEGTDVLNALSFVIKILPVIAMICFMEFAIYEIFGGGVGGVTFHFLLAVGMSYLSGCFYPSYLFPKVIKDFGAVLPSGAGFTYLRQTVRGELSFESFARVCVYALIFALAAVLARRKALGDAK